MVREHEPHTYPLGVCECSSLIGGESLSQALHDVLLADVTCTATASPLCDPARGLPRVDYRTPLLIPHCMTSLLGGSASLQGESIPVMGGDLLLTEAQEPRRVVVENISLLRFA